jgi:2-oxoglutarate dehydrogenase E1 component
MKDFQYITNASTAVIEGLYQDFVKDPASVDLEFRKFFEGFDFAVSHAVENGTNKSSVSVASGNIGAEWAVYQLIEAYRKKGHLMSKTNPVRERIDRGAKLDLRYFGLSDEDLNKEFQAAQFIGLPPSTLKAIVDKLKQTYCHHIGIQYTYIDDPEKLDWLTQAIENDLSRPLSIDQKRRILNKLNEGVIFEKFLHTKYIGQKRFSLEGGETTIAALDAIINIVSTLGVKEVVLGMAHRGRLNVLANTLGKTYEQIFNEFEGQALPDSTMGSGDVKYHLGFTSDVVTVTGNNVHLKLCANPSHLEAVDPVVMGYARSKADVMHGGDCSKVLPILIHGDASVAGQGIVYEVVQMSQLEGYQTGGSIHFVINNQIGFTTDFEDARSADYSTSVASMIQAPVFHVNGDDPEAVIKVCELAAKYRQKFKSDIFIDMVCYRRHGHNEGDEPKFTQPQLYALIDKHLNPREVYTQFLMENGTPDAKTMAKEMETRFLKELQDRLDEVKQNPLPYQYQKPELAWQQLRKATHEDFHSSPETAVNKDILANLFGLLMKWPADFKPLKKVEKLIQDKIKLYEDQQKIDWATAELLAYASLNHEGMDVRMSGQDVKRGTFSHRHAVLFDEKTNAEHNRLDACATEGAQFRIFNSFLSEYAVLGFEYGYAMANPQTLVIWEAQFGDFCNGAQIIIDQFLSSAETKWQKMNGLMMLLPHGYEGQGPEHSSARMERFLQQCAEMNMVITNITTASNFFHAIRRQMTWPFRKPMVNFSPKANLRHPGTYSEISEFTQTGFKEVIDDAHADPTQIKKVLMCSGKIYFDLEEKRQKEGRKDIAILRLEQLYPLPQNQLDVLYQKYNKAIWYWVQEEPLNMGAATYLRMNLKNINFYIFSRLSSAATATGFSKIHAMEQAKILDAAFNQ